MTNARNDERGESTPRRGPPRELSEFEIERLLTEEPRGANLVTRALALALALAADSRFDELQRLYRLALAHGVPPQALTEGALATHLFGGFPRAIESFFALDKAGGLTAEGLEKDVRDASTRAAEGARLFDRIYGRSSSAVRSQLRRYGPDFEEAVLHDAYGRILARSTLDAKTRELMAICALSALRLDRQLFSHLRGAVALGASHDDARSMIDLADAVAPDCGECARATFRNALGVDF